MCHAVDAKMRVHWHCVSAMCGGAVGSLYVTADERCTACGPPTTDIVSIADSAFIGGGALLVVTNSSCSETVVQLQRSQYLSFVFSDT